MAASRAASQALRLLSGQARHWCRRQSLSPALSADRLAWALAPAAGRWKSSGSTSSAKEDDEDASAGRSPVSPPTTYEGSSEDSLWTRIWTTGAFSRSTFVTSTKCSNNDLRAKYELGEELGSGATAKVYSAVKRRTGESVAVKIISRSHVKDVQMLQNEIAIHKSTDHPNILRLLEVFEDDANLYLVAEVCKGGDLGKLLNTHGDEYSTVVIPEEDAMRLLQQVVNSVHYLHSKGIVHRDLKPNNFLIAASSDEDSDTHNKILKLADFGVSAYCDEKHRLTKRVGTDGFMAPEVTRNQPYNEKADIFSIGCILHMMLTGHPPKQKDCGMYHMSKIRLQFVSPDMRSLVESCMQMNPDDRPSAQEIYQMPLLKRTREQDWVNSARLDAQLLDQMYAYCSFPLLKKAALVAMVSRAESDSQFANCIEKFMSLEGARKTGLSVEDIQLALNAELVSDMERKARHMLSEPCMDDAVSPLHRVKRLMIASARRRRRQRTHIEVPPGAAAASRSKFANELKIVADDLVHKIDVDETNLISYSEWLAATVDASWYTDSRRIQAAFRLFDCDGDGVISQEDLKKVMPDAFKNLDVREVLLESQHSTQSEDGMREKDFALLIRTHKPSKFTLTRIRDGVEDPLLPS